MTARIYPDEPAGPFPEPPLSFEDGEGRAVEIRAFDGGESDDDSGTGSDDTDSTDASVDALVAMYEDFDPADRAQGIPPTGEDRIRQWLDTILEGSVNAVACHDGDVVGHATLVPDDDGNYELAIFVQSDYQGAGIGSKLLRALLGLGQSRDVERVWLTVERWNTPAVSLYESVGFETCATESFELEMALRLA